MLALFVLPLEASGQVIINQAALDQLAGIPPPVITAPEVIRQPAPRPAGYRHSQPRHHAPAVALSNAAPAAEKIPAPLKTPPAPAVTPVAVKPPTPKVVPPPQPLPTVVIDFAAGSADLPGNGAAALKPICTHSGAVVTIDAYAAADPSDPSTAARLSMSRAFAIRDALSACGIPVSNIIPRANGAAKTNNPDAAEVIPSP